MYTVARPHYENNFFSPAHSFDDFIAPGFGRTRWMNLMPHACQELKKFQNEATVNKDNSNFEVKINIQDYKPDELDVKTVDGHVVITGKHEEKKDEHGYVSRRFRRRYILPEGVKPECITCSLSSDGFLSVSAPLAIENAPENERKIPISFTPMEDLLLPLQ